MNVIWREGAPTARHIAEVLQQEVGWNINTTYTLIKRCIAKGAVERSEPNFVCRAKVEKQAVQHEQTDELIDRIFDGATSKLFASLLGRKKLSRNEGEELKDYIAQMEAKQI